MTDLLGALGQAWIRVLIFPGGLSAFLLSLLVAYISGCRRLERLCAVTLLDALPPLCAITLLPLAAAPSFPYGLDLPTALLLLLWPIVRRFTTTTLDPPHLIESYIPLLSAMLALTSATTTFDLSGLIRWPTELPYQIALGIGTVTWLAALPHLLPPPTDLALATSRLGLILIGSLPLSTALSVYTEIGGTLPWLITAMSSATAIAGTIAFGYAPVSVRYVLAGGAFIAAGWILGAGQ
ncbi:MAG: hypothetical protein KatS3mg055_1541 [Chloroflexus sp.]|uniref:hypothetical protein n=1 Tax=Chloroflexus sp. TaxID=1904827 RepID=UPI0021DC5DFC|nr:hypothetical protein [Chloroflexus sp.]GIV89023.1 MAG: hypothetical protein KatS3mg055_1541 [Chloroflexus sp.]